jgi:tellurite resistance protein
VQTVFSGRELPSAGAGALQAALHDALTRTAPGLARDAAQATSHFQALLEAGYLVASADGFADTERHALAALLEAASGKAVDRESFELHFRDLDDAVQMLGRRERLRRTAEEFEAPAARDEAIGFALLVAVGDGKLAPPEAAAWLELGSILGYAEDALERRAQEILDQLELALRKHS